MKKCPYCNTTYSNNDFYCIKDNYRLIPVESNEAKSTQSSEYNTNTKTLICPNCQYKNEVLVIDLTNDTITCSNCNVDFYYDTPHRAKTIKNNRNPNIYNKPAQQTNNKNTPKCPTCGSTNVNKISTAKKAAGFLTVGVFSSNLGKTMECKNCGYKW